MVLSFTIEALASSNELNYRLTVKGNFKKSVHGKKYFPGNPHFSPVVGVSHNKFYRLFPKDTFASKGVKIVAETGNPQELLSELLEAQNKKSILDYNTSAPFDGDETVSITLKVNKSNPYISLITMIAPSPDWVVGVNFLKVIRNGKYLKRKVYPLYAIDAGTDSGKIYTSSDKPTRPQVKIKKLLKVGSKSVKDVPFAFLLVEKI